MYLLDTNFIWFSHPIIISLHPFGELTCFCLLSPENPITSSQDPPLELSVYLHIFGVILLANKSKYLFSSNLLTSLKEKQQNLHKQLLFILRKSILRDARVSFELFLRHYQSIDRNASSLLSLPLINFTLPPNQ